MRRLRVVLLAALLVGLAGSAVAKASVQVHELKCEFARDPLGVDVPTPRLSWQLESGERGQRQTAYEILVASSPALLSKDRGDLWNSGKKKSDANLLIPYEGKALSSSQQAFWKVRIWDKDGHKSAWSDPASWTMGILRDADWQARWIGVSTNATGLFRYIGYHAAETRSQDDTKWVQVDLGRRVPIDQVVLKPMDHYKKKGFGFPLRFKVEASDSEGFEQPVLVVDHTQEDFPNPGVEDVVFPSTGLQARYVRVTATRLWKRDSVVYSFALCQLQVLSGGINIAQDRPVSSKDTVENYGWSRKGLTDGHCANPEGFRDPQTVIMRTEFEVQPGLKRALLQVCGLGTYEFQVNGKKVGDALFPSGWTKYDKTCLYDSYEITSLLHQGRNGAGILLGNGMYNILGGRYQKLTGSFGPLKAIGQIRMEYADGSVRIVGTGEGWKMHPGPITFSCVYGGEDYDARLEQDGWSKPGFDEAGWDPVLPVAGPGGKLRGMSCSSPPIRSFEILKPVKITSLRDGVQVFDLGQNVSLMPRLVASGPAGSVVRIIPAELIHADGSVDRQSCGRGNAWWQYTLKGVGSEECLPKFYYHGARYLQVECTSPKGEELPSVSVEGLVVHADCQPVGEFECSNGLFNRIRTLIRWAQRSNMMSVMTDCPHREKLGWLEEDHLNGPSLRYEFNLARLFTKMLNDMADSQLEDGLVPDIAPEYVKFNGGFRDSPEWGSACILVPWQQYLFHGDIELLRRYFPVMESYVAYLGTRATNHIVSHGLGDWYDIGPNPPGVAQLTPIPLTATAFYYYDAWVLSQAARLLGDSTKEKQYGDLAAAVRASFNKEFFHPDKGFYAGNSQAGNAIALDMNLAPESARAGLVEAIVADVGAHGNALTAGDVGYRYLLRALADGGRSDVIYAINNQSEKPGYGYQLSHGATSLTEAWDAGPRSSQNHFMLGQIMEWFYHDLAGIQPCLENPGFKKVRIKPAVLEDIAWVRAGYRSDLGPIRSQWEKKDGKLLLTAVIPPNAVAEVYFPCARTRDIREGGKTAAKANGVKFLRVEDGCSVFSIGSGSYSFEAPL